MESGKSYDGDCDEIDSEDSRSNGDHSSIYFGENNSGDNNSGDNFRYNGHFYSEDSDNPNGEVRYVNESTHKEPIDDYDNDSQRTIDYAVSSSSSNNSDEDSDKDDSNDSNKSNSDHDSDQYLDRDSDEDADQNSDHNVDQDSDRDANGDYNNSNSDKNQDSDKENNGDCNNTNSAQDCDEAKNGDYNNTESDQASDEDVNVDCRISFSSLDFDTDDNSFSKCQEDCDNNKDGLHLNIDSDEDSDKDDNSNSSINNSHDDSTDENDNSYINPHEHYIPDIFRTVHRSMGYGIPVCSVIEPLILSTNIVEPKSVKPPKKMRKYLCKLRNFIYACGDTVKYPGCILYIDIKDFHVVDIFRASFLNKHKLVFLYRIAQYMKLAKSKAGAFLKQILLNSQSHNLVHVHNITNHESDLYEYPLVYGCIPVRYEGVALHFINIFKKEFFKRKLTGSTDYSDFNQYVVLTEGEIEIWLYCYWELHTQDLVVHSNVSKRRIKKLLAYAWSFLSDEDLKQDLTKYSDFGHSRNISKICLYWIKNNFKAIIGNISQNRETKQEAVNAWMLFMKTCNIHHYLCNHTIIEIQKRTSEIKKIINYFVDGVPKGSNNSMLENIAPSTCCILCSNMTATKILTVNAKIQTPACMICLYYVNNLSVDLRVVAERIKLHYEAPILFNAYGITRVLIEDMEDQLRTAVVYNRILKNVDIVNKRRKTYKIALPPTQLKGY